LPNPELNNHTFNVGIGCIVGGSSAVNGQVFQRGTAGDYDLWGELSDDKNSTWNWKDLFGYFKKVSGILYAIGPWLRMRAKLKTPT